MKACALLLCLAVTTLSAYSQTAAPNQDVPSREAVQRVVDGRMLPYLQRIQAPGAIVGVSLHGQRYYFTYGRATDAGAPFRPDTLVEIGSCTKVFTTTLFSLAIDRGQIQPNASAQLFMPHGYTLKTPEVTPLELADFQSGMPRVPEDLPREHDIRQYTSKDFLKWAAHWKGPVTHQYLYSNASVGLLAYLVETATGVPWKDAIQQQIAAPLGMVDTLAEPSGSEWPRMAEGHTATGAPARPWPLFAWFGGGALRSTASDMLSFGEANLGHMQVQGHTVPAALTMAMAHAQKPIYQHTENTEQAMAWNINLGDEPGLKPEILKNGGTDGFGTVILLNPAKDEAIFIAVNQGKSEPAPLAVAIGRHLR